MELPWWFSGKETTLQSRDMVSIPGWEIKIPHATWLGKNLKKKIKQNCLILVLILNKKLKKK